MTETRFDGEPRITDRGPRAHRSALWLYGLGTFLAFGHELPFGLEVAGHTSFDFGLVFAWLVPAALIVGIADLAPRRAAWVGFWSSLLAHAAFFYWFVVVTVEYGGMPLLLGVLAPLAPALYVSLFTALFAFCWARVDVRAGVSIGLGAALWVAVDWARGHFLGGFPWATLGYALHLDLPLLAWSRWTGVYGLSFAAAAVGIALGRAFLERSIPSRRRAVVTVAAVLALHAVGYAMISSVEPGEGSTPIRVAAIQGNIDQGEKWQADRRVRILSTYLRLSEEAASREPGPDWIVWPETAVPGLIENDAGLRSQLALLARRHDVSLVVGAMGVEIDEQARRFSAFFDSAFQIEPDGQVRDRYDKTHLVPFGEFVPLRGVLGHFFQSLARGLSSTDVTAGAAPRNMLLRGRDAGAARIPVGVPICYELLFPHLVREFGGQGARALLAITNDAWYGRTGAPHQFLAMTSLRAAESGLPTVRAANTGISAIIDPDGRVSKAGPLFEEAIVEGEIRLPNDAAPRTFYASYGDVFAWLCVAVSVGSVGGLFWSRRGGRSEESANGDPVASNGMGRGPQ